MRDKNLDRSSDDGKQDQGQNSSCSSLTTPQIESEFVHPEPSYRSDESSTSDVYVKTQNFMALILKESDEEFKLKL